MKVSRHNGFKNFRKIYLGKRELSTHQLTGTRHTGTHNRHNTQRYQGRNSTHIITINWQKKFAFGFQKSL